ncbi:MAG TPA: adenosine deaminase [Acidimicrobiales bacterium]|jgi:adenosine deaminase|nr:adenosine deaminase [Acidimicrobiales bacterium]
MASTGLTLETIKRAPKILLHEHLDGGLRPETVLELARENNYQGLPTSDADELRRWFIVDAPGSDLVRYLEGFAHTIAVMQTRDQLERVAAECAIDLARDGVVYAEVRFAPELHLNAGLTLPEVVRAVLDGFALGNKEAANEGHRIVVRTILSAMRQARLSETIAGLAVSFRDEGVCGFDIAGPEDGFRPTDHLRAFHLIQREDFHLTIHAGEAFGLPSIWEAVQFCNAERLGHGVRIVDDIREVDGHHELGRLANYVRDRRIPLEVCPTSNVHTGAAASIATHPIDLLKRLRFRVTLNTDNRLMSGITLSGEFETCANAFGWTLADMEWLTLNAAKSTFYEFDQRLAMINNVIKPGYAALRDLEPQ